MSDFNQLLDERIKFISQQENKTNDEILNKLESEYDSQEKSTFCLRGQSVNICENNDKDLCVDKTSTKLTDLLTSQ